MLLLPAPTAAAAAGLAKCCVNPYASVAQVVWPPVVSGLVYAVVDIGATWAMVRPR